MSRHGDPDFDELAELFLTEPDEADAAGERTGGIELVVVGSLPVRASLWLVPYVDAVAREVGPAVLVRLDEELPSLQVLRAPDALELQPWSELSEAITDLSPHVAWWIVRPPLDVTAHQMATAGCDRITILCSANQGSAVDAYGRIKTLVEAGGPGLSRLGVAVLGEDRHRAQAMHRKLSHTASTKLEVELPLVACIQKMNASTRASQRLTFGAHSRASLQTVLGWIRDAAASVAEPVALPRVATERAAVAAPPQSSEAPPVDAGPQRPIKMRPKPSIELEPKDPIETVEADEHGERALLAGHIDGVTFLGVRCPGHERLEVGVDASGRLHVMACEEQMREIPVVEAWACAHRELIDKASPDQWIDTSATTVICHVFTDTPASLADLHSTGYRLHVLTPVTVDGHRGWYYAPLNASV